MSDFDFVIIGAGAAGEAAAHKARALGASVLIVDRGWFGGTCPHTGCMPSKSLLHGASRHASGAGYSWEQASARRDWIINRAPRAEAPDDTGHIRALEDAGAVVRRGEGSIVGRGRVRIRRGDGTEEIDADNIVIAVGSRPKVPPIEGLAAAQPWTNREGTLARDLPRSLLVLGGGPTGCELAQVYARFGVPTVVVQSGPRLVPTDHPRNAEAIRFALERDGVRVRTGARAIRVRPRGGADGAHTVELDDGTTVEGHEILLAVGREFPLDDLGLEHYGIDPSGRTSLPRDGRLRLADGLWVAGDPAGPELHTHQAHFQGEMVARMALGEEVTPDYRALPRATYTDPEAAFVGLSLEQALDAGVDAFDIVAAFPETSRGYAMEAETGHVTLVVDRATRELVGAAIAAPDASAAIHECVVAIHARVPVDVLAETIHAFPSTSRILDGLYGEARERLDAPPADSGGGTGSSRGDGQTS
jgi:pyruvate/2-oxoglutarate dehydrogenase complex dihydrolipoamide dehydrogenase (E3) component